MGEKLKNESRWSKAALCIYGETLQPDEISSALGLQPTNSGLKGQRQSKYPNARELRRSIWILDATVDEHLPLQDHLESLLDALEPRLIAISGIAKQYDTRLICGYSSEHGQGGCTFDAALLGRLAKFGVPLVVDLYPPGPMVLDQTNQD